MLIGTTAYRDLDSPSPFGLGSARHGPGACPAGQWPAAYRHPAARPPAFWAKTIAALTSSCEVVAVDLPGFGDTALLPDAPSVPGLADAVANWIAGVGLDHPHVAGNSLGGAVAIELAKQNAVAGAVAISPVGFWTHKEAARALRSLRVGRAVGRAVAARPGLITRTGFGRTLAFGQLVARPRRMPESTARSALLGLATAPGFETIRDEVLAYRVQGPEPEVPVTIAWAAKDRMTPPRQADRARKLLPHAKLVTLPGCGHAAMVDDPELVARVVLDAMANGSGSKPRTADPAQASTE
jgi:pimeloyl-ACP methyl ester carboxylesterase